MAQTFAEDQYGKKVDRCLSDTVLKFALVENVLFGAALQSSFWFSGGGLVLGSVFSLLFFKRRAWPIIIGSGFGIGVAYNNCERSLNASK